MGEERHPRRVTFGELVGGKVYSGDHTTSFSLAASVRHAAACSESGGVFLAGVRPDSPSRSDTFLLLRVAARLRRGGRVGSYVVH